MLGCLGSRERRYKMDEIIFRAGEAVTEIGLVESGSANVVVNFWWGNSNIFGHVRKGDIFAENYAAIPGKELLCDVVAAEDAEVLFLGLGKLLTTCENGCPSCVGPVGEIGMDGKGTAILLLQELLRTYLDRK